MRRPIGWPRPCATGALNGGKRLRPLLVVETAGVFGVSAEAAMRAAVAVELIHCFSLVHDDLPAMDDDDLRRGKPTVHKAFDEATAILAGDALHSHAFAILADEKTHADPAVRMALIGELATATGAGGMAGGQQLDLEGELGGFSDADIAVMQKMKTGALIRAAVRMGGLIGGAGPDAMKALTLYGEAAGRAFQLADDILDLTATAEQMGKATHKDGARNKPTLVARIGLDGAQAPSRRPDPPRPVGPVDFRAGSQFPQVHRPLFRHKGKMMQLLSVNIGKARPFDNENGPYRHFQDAGRRPGQRACARGRCGRHLQPAFPWRQGSSGLYLRPAGLRLLGGRTRP